MKERIDMTNTPIKKDKDTDLEYIKETTALIKKIRTEASLSQIEVSNKTGMVQQLISRIDTNIVNPRLASVKKYLEVCGVDLDELLRNALVNMNKGEGNGE